MKTLRFIGMVFATIVLSATLIACSDDDNAEGVSSSGKIKGHSYADLGLSVKWATCNVGASSPSDFGDYFSWGETEPKEEYTTSVTDGKWLYEGIAGNPTYDAARANWGGTWRLPTRSEIDELISECSTIWTMRNDQYGYLVTAPNGNSIFLPAAGYIDGTSHCDTRAGYIWSDTKGDWETPYYAYCLYFNSTSIECKDSRDSDHLMYRSYGCSIRPVSE